MTRKPAKSDAAASSRLTEYELLVGVCGGIAAYKVCSVVSTLVQAGCGVSVSMTEAATRFVGPLTFQSLTGRQVFTSLWSAEDRCDPQHLRLTERADLFLIAPATANTIGKVAAGIADDLLSALVMGADSSVVLAPTMNTRMWQNPIVQANVSALRERGYEFIDPEEGWLACRTVGVGRMAEPETIVTRVRDLLTKQPPKAARS